MSIEAMKQALEYVQEFKRRWWAVPPFGNKVNKATREAVSAAHSPIFQIEDALCAAIEQAEKPVAYLVEYLNGEKEVRFQPNGWGDKVTLLYTAPRQWVGLTDEERYGLYRKAGLESYHLPSSEVQYKYDRCIESYARAIEAKLKEKNT
jgi:hypothetical protein